MLLHSNCPYCTSIAHKLHIKDYERFGEHTMNLKIWRLIRYRREIPWSITDTFRTFIGQEHRQLVGHTEGEDENG